MATERGAVVGTTTVRTTPPADATRRTTPPEDLAARSRRDSSAATGDGGSAPVVVGCMVGDEETGAAPAVVTDVDADRPRNATIPSVEVAAAPATTIRVTLAG